MLASTRSPGGPSERRCKRTSRDASYTVPVTPRNPPTHPIVRAALLVCATPSFATLRSRRPPGPLVVFHLRVGSKFQTPPYFEMTRGQGQPENLDSGMAPDKSPVVDEVVAVPPDAPGTFLESVIGSKYDNCRLFGYFLTQIAVSPYFTAGFGLMVCYALRRFSWKGSNVQAVQGVGVGLAGLRRSLTFFSHALRRHMLVTLEIPNRDKAFEWFLAWQAQANLAAKAARFIRSHELSLETTYRQHANGSSVSVLPRPCCRLVRAAALIPPPCCPPHPCRPHVCVALLVPATSDSGANTGTFYTQSTAPNA